MTGEQAGALLVPDLLGDPKTVELLHTLAAEAHRSGKDRPFDGDELARFTSHSRIVRIYMRLVKPQLSSASSRGLKYTISLAQHSYLGSGTMAMPELPNPHDVLSPEDHGAMSQRFRIHAEREMAGGRRQQASEKTWGAVAYYPTRIPPCDLPVPLLHDVDGKAVRGREGARALGRVGKPLLAGTRGASAACVHLWFRYRTWRE